MSVQLKEINVYLILYNALLFLGWLVFLSYSLTQGLNLNSWSLKLLNVIQIAALLEIFHAQMKWVSTPALTSLKQVSSRILVLVFINLLAPEAYVNIGPFNGLKAIIIAWSITEIIRYAFYFSKLIRAELEGLNWSRYTLFIVLYPLGVLGELLIIYSFFNSYNWFPKWLIGVFAILLLIYLVFFPGMFKHMLNQRKKKL